MNDELRIDDRELQELLNEIEQISSYAQIRAWKERASGEIEHLKSIVRGLDVEIARDAHALETLRYEASKKMLGKLFGAGKEEKELSRRLDEYKTSKTGLLQAATQLQDLIDFTPLSTEERESLLNELRLKKRELQEKKREITQVVRGPRMAKPKNEPVDTVFDAATRERRKARYEREAELLPGETTSASLTRQITWVDSEIQRIENFPQ